MEENKEEKKPTRCEECEHFSWGVCDLRRFRYDHDWTCKELKPKNK